MKSRGKETTFFFYLIDHRQGSFAASSEVLGKAPVDVSATLLGAPVNLSSTGSGPNYKFMHLVVDLLT